MLTIAQVVKNPDRVFKGLKRDGKHDAYAFLGRPTERYVLNADGVPSGQPVAGKKVFLVYADRYLCIYHHAWVDLDFDCPGQSLAEAEDQYVTMCFSEEISHARRS